MANPRQDGLGFLDRLVILVAWLASCGVVFVIGYYVGKDAVPASTGIQPGVIQVPVAGVPVVPEEPRDGGTFYESLGRQTGTPVSAPTPRAVATTVPVREAAARATTSTAVPPRPSTTHVPAPPALAPPTTIAVPRPPTTHPPAAAGSVVGGRSWTLYVSPTRDRFEAERQRAALRAAGYEASVVRMQRDGDVWYRVRAGRYGTEAAAEQARRDLRDRGIGHAFVQSD
jgi:cell division protein FtsN